jgi:hypothetical protein
VAADNKAGIIAGFFINEQKTERRVLKVPVSTLSPE